MSEKKKKIFPKLKKKLEDFLTDESGEITKKDALGVAAGATLMASVESVSADTPIFGSKDASHSNGDLWGRASCSVYGKAVHVSGIVNGHISQNPEVEIRVYNSVETGHNSHSAHGSHGSHGSRW